MDVPLFKNNILCDIFLHKMMRETWNDQTTWLVSTEETKTMLVSIDKYRNVLESYVITNKKYHRTHNVV